MTPVSLTLFLIIGAVAGWLAGLVMEDGRFGFFGNIVVGIIGAVMGGFIFSLFGITAGGIMASLAAALAGSLFLLYLTRFI